ncbi:MAG: hypothetical protein AAF533_10790 [Acidobacteriota bacterium]
MSDAKAHLALLGRELKRLRGKRTRADVADQTDQHAFTASIDEVSLGRLEAGELEPTTDLLFSLSTAYKVSLLQLLDFIVIGRIIAEVPVPSTLAEVDRELKEAFGLGDWLRALPLAVRGEQLSEDPTSEVKYRADRWAAAERIGLRESALIGLAQCAESRHVEEHRRHRIYSALAYSFSSAGLFTLAAHSAKEALLLAPTELTPERRWGLIQTRVVLTVAQSEAGQPVGFGDLDEAEALLDEALDATDAGDLRKELHVEMLRGLVIKARNQEVQAELHLSRLVESAEESEQGYLLMMLRLHLGALRRFLGDHDGARAVLTQAAEYGKSRGYVEEMFEISFQRFRLSIEANDGETKKHLETCGEYFSRVHGTTPSTVQFEELIREHSS